MRRGECRKRRRNQRGEVEVGVEPPSSQSTKVMLELYKVRNSLV